MSVSPLTRTFCFTSCQGDKQLNAMLQGRDVVASSMVRMEALVYDGKNKHTDLRGATWWWWSETNTSFKRPDYRW
jgi:hypothetical protein